MNLKQLIFSSIMTITAVYWFVRVYAFTMDFKRTINFRSLFFAIGLAGLLHLLIIASVIVYGTLEDE